MARKAADPLVYTTTEPNTGCWLWLGEVNNKGYGRLSRTTAGKRTRILVHRYFYERFKGPIPEGGTLLHKCDIPSCVNPAHLIIGTQKENAIDMARKKRQHLQKITEDQAKEIKIALRYERSTIVSKRLGVSIHIVSDIRRQHSWRHLEC